MMIAVNALAPSRYAPRQVDALPTVNPPASLNNEATVLPTIPPTGQDTTSFNQTETTPPEAPPAPEAEAPVPSEQASAEASPEKKKAWYQSGAAGPLALGSLATGIGAIIAVAGKEEGHFRGVLGAAVAASIALWGANVIAAKNKTPETAPANTPVA